jgi:predicted nucleic acid-binding protein
MIVVLDTSVWISALEFGGIPDLALVRAPSMDQVAISDFIRTEIMRVLTGKFSRDPAELESQLDELFVQAFFVEVTGEITGICAIPTTMPSLKQRGKRGPIILSPATRTCSASARSREP